MARMYHFIIRFLYRETNQGENGSITLPIMYCSRKEAIEYSDAYMENHNKMFNKKLASYTIYQESYRNAVEPEEV